MKKLFLLILLLAVFTSTVFAGSGTAVLTCESESGRTKLKIYLQDVVGLLEGAEFTIDNSTIKFGNNDEVYTIFDPKNGVFTMHIEGKASEENPNPKYLQFWAVPLTFKTVKNADYHQIYEFRAKVYGSEPRPDKAMHCPVIELKCRLEYQI